MGVSMGTLDIGFNANLSSLNAQLNKAMGSMRATLVQMGKDMTASEQYTRSWFSSMRTGAMILGGAMILASTQGQHLLEALGKLNQLVIDATIGPAIERIANGIERLVTNIRALGATAGFEKTFSQETKVTIVAIAGAIGGLLVKALVGLNITMASLATTLQTAAIAAWQFIAPFLPWLVIGAAVAVLAYLLWQNWDTVVQWLVDSFNWLYEGVVSIFTGIGNAISSAWNWVVNTTRSVWNSIIAFFQEWGLTLLVVFGGPIGWLLAIIINNWSKIKSTTMSVFQSIANFFRSIWASIVGAVSPFVNSISNAISSGWNRVSSITRSIWNSIKSWLTGIWNGVASSAGSIWNKVTSAIAGAWSSLSSKASSIWSGIYNAIARWVNRALSVIAPLMNGINKAVKGINSVTGAKLPTLPAPKMMAKGGIVTGPTFAMVGEGRYSEAVLPLSNATFSALAEGITAKMSGGGGGAGIVIQNMVVREEADITRIAEKLHRLQTIQNRAGGIV